MPIKKPQPKPAAEAAKPAAAKADAAEAPKAKPAAATTKAPAKEQTKAEAPKQEKAMVKAHNTSIEEVPDYIAGANNDAGRENIDGDDVGIPMLYIAQALTPEVQFKQKKEQAGEFYLDGAGVMFHRQAQHVFGEEMHLVVLHYDKEYVLWRDRKAGGGIEARWSATDVPPGREKDCEWGEDNGKRIAPRANLTRNFICLEYDIANGELDPNNIGPFMFSMARGASKGARELTTLMKRRAKGTPAYAGLYRVTLDLKEYQQGAAYEPRFHNAGWVDATSFEALKKIYKEHIEPMIGTTALQTKYGKDDTEPTDAPAGATIDTEAAPSGEEEPVGNESF